MQHCDAILLSTVLAELKPIIVGGRVNRIQQTGRDEIILIGHTKQGQFALIISANPNFGRICLTHKPVLVKEKTWSPFGLLLRKSLSGATITALEQSPGERRVDFIFQALDEVGTKSTKILSAEIMGKHSNLIFWAPENRTILAVSHNVTSEMSRVRELAPGLTYVPPPPLGRTNIFAVLRPALEKLIEKHLAGKHQNQNSETDLAQLRTFLHHELAGISKEHLADLVNSILSTVGSSTASSLTEHKWAELLWERIEAIKKHSLPFLLANDQSRFSVVLPDITTGWNKLVSANELVDQYFSYHKERNRLEQLKAELETHHNKERQRLVAQVTSANKALAEAEQCSRLKIAGDLLLANLDKFQPGSNQIICSNYFEEGAPDTTLVIDSQLTATQNAQLYYKKASKLRQKAESAKKIAQEATKKIVELDKILKVIQAATTPSELESININTGFAVQPTARSNKPKHQHRLPKLMNFISTDGYTVYLGRNRQQNDQLLSKLSSPQDIWMHVAGAGGAHVLIKVPSTKREPPLTTLQEAAAIAARFSKAVGSGKVPVLYTHYRYVRKISGSGPGAVTYEKEKTITANPSFITNSILAQLHESKTT